MTESSQDRSRRSRTVPLLTLLVVLGSIACVVLALNRPSAPAAAAEPPSASGGQYLPADLPGAAGPALVAAVGKVPPALSYNFRQMTYQINVAVQGMTDSFAKAYKANVYSEVAPRARATRATAQVRVLAAGVVSTEGDDEATCLLYVDRQVRAEDPPPGTRSRTTEHYRVLVRVQKVDGIWKVDDIAPV